MLGGIGNYQTLSCSSLFATCTVSIVQLSSLDRFSGTGRHSKQRNFHTKTPSFLCLQLFGTLALCQLLPTT